jgi:hypothetical protein
LLLSISYLVNRTVEDGYNQRFAVAAAAPGSAFLPYVGRPLADILCVQEDRRVGGSGAGATFGKGYQLASLYVILTVRN